MVFKNLVSVLCVLYLHFPSGSIQNSSKSLYYVGAVVEYHPIKGISETAAISNVDNYIQILKKAKELNSDLDIIVYPETGILIKSDDQSFLSIEEERQLYKSLAFISPHSSEKITPCEIEDSIVSKVVKKLSCAARKYNTYIVVNYVEKEECNNCAKDNINLYNSNIVFDRNGTVISRYRKYNLFMEEAFNVTSEAEFSTFETDFGVRFGQFICFDILFKTPALKLLEKYQVRDIVYPTHWFAELPFLDALSVQAAWSHANDVNLLASGFNNPSTASTGSGIFAGKYPTIPGVFRSEINKNALLIANVPKVINGFRNNIDIEKILYEFSNEEVQTIQNRTNLTEFLTDFLSDFKTILVEPEMDQFVTLCQNEFCCHFNQKAEYNNTAIELKDKFYRYRFGIFAGVRLYGVVNAGVQVCGLMICANDSLSSCGKKLDTENNIKFATNFKKLQITALVPKRENVYLLNLPISFQTDYTPLHSTDFSFKSITLEDFYVLSLTLKESERNLITFGIYSRNFSSDGKKVTTLESSHFPSSFLN